MAESGPLKKVDIEAIELALRKIKENGIQVDEFWNRPGGEIRNRSEEDKVMKKREIRDVIKKAGRKIAHTAKKGKEEKGVYRKIIKNVIRRTIRIVRKEIRDTRSPTPCSTPYSPTASPSYIPPESQPHSPSFGTWSIIPSPIPDIRTYEQSPTIHIEPSYSPGHSPNGSKENPYSIE